MGHRYVPQAWGQLFLLSGALIAPCASARTWHVPSEVPRIQQAVDLAQAGDDVVLAPGTYTWTSESATSAIVTLKPGIWLHSEAGAASTILDAENQGRVIVCPDVGADTRIEGLTITRGHSVTQGGGIYVTGDSSPSIAFCLIRLNGGGRGGGGIFCDRADIANCEFSDNRANTDGIGGGISCGAATISNCTFLRNSCTGDFLARGGAVASQSATISNCVFTDNAVGAFMACSGGAISDIGTASISFCTFDSNISQTVRNSSLGGAVRVTAGIVSDCTFINCRAIGTSAFSQRGGGVFSTRADILRCSFIGCSAMRTTSPVGPGFGGAIATSESVRIESCTLFGNSGGTADGVGGISFGGASTAHRVLLVSTSAGQACVGSATWTCSDLFNNVEGDTICGTDGGENFSQDPLFCSTDPGTTHDVTIRANSPCAPGKHPDAAACGLIGSGPVACESIAIEPRSWSAMKSLYRDATR